MSKPKSQPAKQPTDEQPAEASKASKAPKVPPRATYAPTPKSGLYVREDGITRAVGVTRAIEETVDESVEETKDEPAA